MTAVQWLWRLSSPEVAHQGQAFQALQATQGARPPAWRLLTISVQAPPQGTGGLTHWLRRHRADPFQWTAGLCTAAAMEAWSTQLASSRLEPRWPCDRVFLVDGRGHLPRVLRRLEVGTSRQRMPARMDHGHGLLD